MRINATMAAAASSSSAGQQDEGGGGGGVTGGGAVAAPPGGHHLVIHRKPPGPWTELETNHLIDAYQEKWYALKRGQLKARHWEEVAHQVFLRCGGMEPSKSSVQCRHKIEKLRKRYRTEKQQQQSSPSTWSSSKWVFFERMDLLENGPPALRAENNATANPNAALTNGRPLTGTVEHDSDTNDNHHHHTSINHNYPPRGASFHHKAMYHGLPSDDDAAAFLCLRNGETDCGRASPSPRFSVKRRKPPEDPESGHGQLPNQQYHHQPLSELASVVRSLGEGFMRIEQMKMEMQRDNERLRMEMEIKRTEMILESQQLIADVISKALSSSSKKKFKKLQSPDL
ncbi:trihelix transcription factor ENAP1 [Cryptomeria japonica]|uniref:trihelix transcription factor ENAP1 n=1 Tax=Cryptomeria japonica TaxID=3369 RepID=UPI0027D9E6DF|nr:trihelix transcription factor ENAP1 [Cryptomeria japonica]